MNPNQAQDFNGTILTDGDYVMSNWAGKPKRISINDNEVTVHHELKGKKILSKFDKPCTTYSKEGFSQTFYASCPAPVTSRDRLLNTLIHFSETMNPSKSKLFKMLYILDSGEGGSVTGLEYTKTDYGQFPKSLNDEWGSKPKQDFTDTFLKVGNSKGAMVLKAKVKFNPDVFTALQLKRVQDIGRRYFRASGSEIELNSEVSV